MNQISKVIFCLIAIWCIGVGLFNQTISTVDDLPWVAAALAGTDVEAFNPILSIWAHWIGMFLVTAGISLGVIVLRVATTHWSLASASVLAVGTVGAQSYSVLSLGAFGPISYLLYVVPLVAVLAAITGYIGLKGDNSEE